MYQFLDYKIVTEEYDKEFENLMFDRLHCERKDHAYVNDLDDVHFTPELLAKELMDIAKQCPDVNFMCKGTCDASSGSGEYMDFEISYHDHAFDAKIFGWYSYFYKDDYDCYEQLLEEYDDDPPISEAAFNALEDYRPMILPSDSNKLIDPDLGEIPWKKWVLVSTL